MAGFSQAIPSPFLGVIQDMHLEGFITIPQKKFDGAHEDLLFWGGFTAHPRGVGCRVSTGTATLLLCSFLKALPWADPYLIGAFAEKPTPNGVPS
jgi:hypothetical protein